VDCFREEDWEGAIVSAAAALALDDKDEEARLLVALALSEAGGHEVAERLAGSATGANADTVRETICARREAASSQSLGTGQGPPAATPTSTRTRALVWAGIGLPAALVGLFIGWQLGAGERADGPSLMAFLAAPARLPVVSSPPATHSMQPSSEALDGRSAEPAPLAVSESNSVNMEANGLDTAEIEPVTPGPAVVEAVAAAASSQESVHLAARAALAKKVQVRLRPGDSYSGLALLFYGDASRWGRIADLNPAHADPFRLPAGARLVVPVSSCGGDIGG
jgi:hypothetical protein